MMFPTNDSKYKITEIYTNILVDGICTQTLFKPKKNEDISNQLIIHGRLEKLSAHLTSIYLSNINQHPDIKGEFQADRDSCLYKITIPVHLLKNVNQPLEIKANFETKENVELMSISFTKMTDTQNNSVLPPAWLTELMESSFTRRLWKTNPWPKEIVQNLKYLHFGCGDRVFDDFVNVDFIPEHPKVLPWNLLYPWPKEMENKLEGIFSEDVIEHFYRTEQIYILLQSNMALKIKAINRILCPDLDKLYLSAQTEAETYKKSGENSFLINANGSATWADILNYGMRFSGHRWLHTVESLEVIAKECGYSLQQTNCYASQNSHLSGLNLRDETNSLSLAVDLVKEKNIIKQNISTFQTHSLKLIETDESDTFYKLFSTQGIDNQVIFDLDTPVSIRDIVLINMRSCNLSHEYEHSVGKYYFGILHDISKPQNITFSEEYSISLDTSLRSNGSVNMVDGLLLRQRFPENVLVSKVRFNPGNTNNEFIIIGNLEIYIKI